MTLLYFLLKQEIPHTVNLRQIVSAVVCADANRSMLANIKQAPANAHHLSKSAASEFLESFSVTLFTRIRDSLNSVEMYSILADECTDVNNRQSLSVCVRHIDSRGVSETFLSCVSLTETNAISIKEKLYSVLEMFLLPLNKCVSVSFDGASNFSGATGGVYGLMREDIPNLLYIHCRAHVLQLAIVNASDKFAPIKRIISLLRNVYSNFSQSPKRLTELLEIQQAYDMKVLHIVEPSYTRWLSHERCIIVVWERLVPLVQCLESLYVQGEAGNDIGSLRFEFSLDSSLFYLCLLYHILPPLANLSRALQRSNATLHDSYELVHATLEHLRALNLDAILDDAISKSAECEAAGIIMTPLAPDTRNTCLKSAEKYLNLIVKSISDRFSDKFQVVSSFHKILINKANELNADLIPICSLFDVSHSEILKEWPIFCRLSTNYNTLETLLSFVNSSMHKEMFPNIRSILFRLLLLPIGTASVERSFSTMNRILNSDRCRLNSDHVDALMKVSIEGPSIPDIRDSSDDDRTEFCSFITSAYQEFLKKPRRNV